MEFAQFILLNAVDLESILRTDESYFSLSGNVSKHNCSMWSSEKPKEVSRRDMHLPKVCVWYGFSESYRLTPFFFSATITGQNYTVMLRNHALPEIRRKRKMTTTMFQLKSGHFWLKIFQKSG